MDDTRLDQARFLVEHLRRRHFKVELEGPFHVGLSYVGPGDAVCLHQETLLSILAQKAAIGAVLKQEDAPPSVPLWKAVLRAAGR